MMAPDEHPNHQLRINRGPTYFGAKGREFGMQDKSRNRSDLANRVIVRNCFLKSK
jgi:hypothetical protein